jgi:hypothetical protein
VNATCPIWGTPAESTPSIDGRSFEYESPRAGGRYRISGTAVSLVQSFSVPEKKVLTTWLCKQRNAGVDVPQVDGYNIDEIKTYRPMSYTGRINAALLYFDRLNLPLDSTTQVSATGQSNEERHFMAATESIDGKDLLALMKKMHSAGYLDGMATGLMGLFSPSNEGWKRIEQLKVTASSGTQAFVAMWFDPSTQDAYTHGIHEAILDSGYEALRIDKKEHNNRIDDEIIAEIKRSRFLVADFTCGSVTADGATHFIARGGVYFEAGYAMALPIPVIWTCRETSLGGLHFDTRQYAHIVWNDPADLYLQLKNRIGATIGDGPLRR